MECHGRLFTFLCSPHGLGGKTGRCEAITEMLLVVVATAFVNIRSIVCMEEWSVPVWLEPHLLLLICAPAVMEPA